MSSWVNVSIANSRDHDDDAPKCIGGIIPLDPRDIDVRPLSISHPDSQHSDRDGHHESYDHVRLRFQLGFQREVRPPFGSGFLADFLDCVRPPFGPRGEVPEEKVYFGQNENAVKQIKSALSNSERELLLSFPWLS